MCLTWMDSLTSCNISPRQGIAIPGLCLLRAGGGFWSQTCQCHHPLGSSICYIPLTIFVWSGAELCCSACSVSRSSCSGPPGFPMWHDGSREKALKLLFWSAPGFRRREFKPRLALYGEGWMGEGGRTVGLPLREKRAGPGTGRRQSWAKSRWPLSSWRSGDPASKPSPAPDCGPEPTSLCPSLGAVA